MDDYKFQVDFLGEATTVVISTHGIVKKTGKIPKKEIDKAERIRKEYYKQKTKNK